MAAKTDKEFINEIKDLIYKTSLEVTKNVNQAALDHVNKQVPNSIAAAKSTQELFINKVPDAVAKKITQRLNNMLGLNLEVEPEVTVNQ